MRDEAINPSQDRDRFRAAIAAIRARTLVVQCCSTGGAIGMSIDERCGLLLLGRRCSTWRRSTSEPSTGDDIFVNKRQFDTMEIARRITA